MQGECGIREVKGHGILSRQINDQPQEFAPFIAAFLLASLMPRRGILKQSHVTCTGQN
jgi:hypothetical protein